MSRTALSPLGTPWRCFEDLAVGETRQSASRTIGEDEIVAFLADCDCAVMGGDVVNDRVLAAHMIGADAPEIVQSLAVAVTAGVTKAQFDRTLAVHPTAAEEFVLMREPSRSVG